MPRNQTEAFVLRTIPCGDQDKIAMLMTHDRGLLKGIAKGSRKFGNRFGSSLEPMSHVCVHFYEKEHQDLVTISHCDLIESFFELQQNPDSSFTLGYFAELIEGFFPSKGDDDILFRLLKRILQGLKAGGDRHFLSAYFEAWFLKINGLLPNFVFCKQCSQEIEEEGWLSPRKDGGYCASCAEYKKEKFDRETVSFLDWIKKNPPPDQARLPFSEQNIRGIRKILQNIIIYHLEKVPKSLSFIA